MSPSIEQDPFTRPMIIRATIKALCLFILFNLAYGAIQPAQNGLLPSLYNTLFAGRKRFVKGYDYDVSRLVNDHVISLARTDTFNIAFVGSSEAWGLRATPSTSVPATLDNLHMVAQDGRPVRVYNLGYPIPNGIKDLMLLEAVTKRQIPIDLVILSTFESTFEVYPHTILEANQPLLMDTLNHYHLTPIASRIIGATPSGTVFPEWDDRDALSAWLAMQMRGMTWSLIGDDVDASLAHYRQPAQPLAEFLALPDDAHPYPEIFAAFVQFSQEHDIPFLFVEAPVAIGTNAFTPWLQQQSQVAGLPLLDCWHLFDQPDNFEDFYHIMLDLEGPYAQVLAKHLSDGSLAQVPGLPLILTSDFVRPDVSCAVYP